MGHVIQKLIISLQDEGLLSHSEEVKGYPLDHLVDEGNPDGDEEDYIEIESSP